MLGPTLGADRGLIANLTWGSASPRESSQHTGACKSGRVDLIGAYLKQTVVSPGAAELPGISWNGVKRAGAGVCARSASE